MLNCEKESAARHWERESEEREREKIGSLSAVSKIVFHSD